jgi:hypothetical protein
MEALAREADRLLESEAAQEAFAMAKAEIIEQWLEAGTVADREVAWATVQALGEFKRQLRILRGRGEHALLSHPDGEE